MYKEYNGFMLMQALDLPVLLHDDKLTLRASKRTASGEKNIEEDFYRLMARNALISYWNPETGEHIKPNEYNDEKHRGWIACWEWGRQLGKDIFVFVSFNQIDLKICNLWWDFRKRYRISLETAFSAMQGGIIPYKPRAILKERNVWEAIRNRLKRNFKVSEYETNFLLNETIAEIFENEVKSFEDVRIERNTVFIKHSNEATVKFYKPFEREREKFSGDLTNTQKGGKIEITLKRNFFKRAGIRVENLGEQPEIFELIRARIERELNGVFEMLSKTTRRKIACELGIQTIAVEDITKKMTDTKNAMTYIIREILEHRQELAEHRQELAEHRREIQEIKKRLKMF